MIKPAKLIKLVNSIIVLLEGKCCFLTTYIHEPFPHIALNNFEWLLIEFKSTD